MNPYKLREIYKYLTRAKKADPNLPDVFPANKAPIPAKTQNVEEIEAINEFMLRNPRVEKAGGGRIGFKDGPLKISNEKIKETFPSYFKKGYTGSLNEDKIRQILTTYSNKEGGRNYIGNQLKLDQSVIGRVLKTAQANNIIKEVKPGEFKTKDKQRIYKDISERKIYKQVRPITANDRKRNLNIPKNAKFKVQLPSGSKDKSIVVKYFTTADAATNAITKADKFTEAKKIEKKKIFQKPVQAIHRIAMKEAEDISNISNLSKLLYGNSEVQSMTMAANDLVRYQQFLLGFEEVPGIKIPSTEKLNDILSEFPSQDQWGKFASGTLRNAKLQIRDKLLKTKGPGLIKLRNNILKLVDSGVYNLDEVMGVSATFEKAPGYTEFGQVINKDINLKKASEIDSPFSKLFTKVLDGTATIKEVDEFNKKSLAFQKKNKVETPVIRYTPGDKLDPKDFIENFDKLSPEAQVNVKDLANKGVGLETKSMPMSNVLEVVRKNKAQAITDAAIKTASVGGFDEKLKVLCGGKAFGGRVGLANGTDPFCPAARQDPEGFLKKLTADGDIGKFFRSAKAVNVAKNVARLSLDAANPFTLLGGEIFYVGLDSANNVSKGLDFDEALDKAFIFYDFDTFDSKILERAKNQGFDENQMNLLRSTLNINKLDNRQKGIEKQFELDESDISGLTSDLTMGSEKDYANVNKQIADESDKYINSLDKMGFDLSKDESYNTGFNYLNNLFKKKTQSELLKSYENRKRKLDPEGGAIGDTLKPIFDTQSYTQPLKYALDIVNPFTKNVGFESDRAKEQRYLNEMDPRELYLYNKERGFTLDDIQAGTSPFLNKAMEDRSLGEAALGKGLFQNYAGGGIAKIAGIDQGPPPVRGPNPQGLPGLLKRGIKI